MSLPINYEKFLSPENWQEILVNVSPVDLCSVMRTSSCMNSLASWPDLWAGMTVNMEMVRQNGLAQLFSINRYKKITKMDFSGSFFTSEELERVIIQVPGSPLDNVNLSSNNLSQIPPHLLANTVSQLKSVDLNNTSLTTDQCIKLMEASISSTTLVNINLGAVNLSKVQPDLLANAICRLQTANLDSTDLTSEQCVKLMEASLSSTTLVNMNLCRVNLSKVQPDLLANAICRLQTANLCATDLTSEQCIKLMEASISSTTLVNINLGWVNLSKVHPDLLANASCRLQTANLYGTDLTSEQCVKLMATNLSSTTLVNMNLSGVDFSEVHPDLLAKAICRLQTVDLSYTDLTSEQCVKLMEGSISSTTLVNINLRRVNLSKVQPDLLAKAICRLQTANLCTTELTSGQCVKLMEASLSSTTLVNMNLGRGADLSEVHPDLLAKAICRLQTVYLYGTRLTSQQCVKFMETSLSSTTLLEVTLFRVDNSKLPTGLLAKARLKYKLHTN